MTRFHYPMPIPEHYSAEQVVAILELLATLHQHLREVYALQLQELDYADLAQLAGEEDERQYDIPF